MSKLFIHGSGMLRRIPLSLENWNWNVSHSWVSLLELGSRQPEFAEKSQDDYLVIELSYMVECNIVEKEKGQIYTRNQKNLAEERISGEESAISVMWEPMERFQPLFDRYIRWIVSQFSPEHIILVRVTCPDRCLSGAFIHRYSPEGKKIFQERIQYFEEYFISQTLCRVIDIARDFMADGNDMKYGLYVSYERLFYRNMGRILRKILSGKSRETSFYQSDYRLALQRYRAFYPAAYQRKEEDLLMERSCAVNCLVRALNLAWIEKYEDILVTLSELKCRDYRELLEKGDFRKQKELERFVVVLQEIEKGIYSEASLAVLESFWGTKAGIVRQIQRIVGEYYQEEEYIGKKLVLGESCQALYSAMVYARQGNYISACESIQKLLPKKWGIRRKKSGSRQDFWRLVSEYGQRKEMTGVDVWGNRITKQMFSSEESAGYISHEILSVNMFDDRAVERKMEMLWSNSASQLVFDIYWVVDTLEQEEYREEEIKEKLDTFMRFAIAQYGREHLLFHRITIQTEYQNETGEMVPLPGAEMMQKKARRLEKFQSYLLVHYPIAQISIGGSYVLCEKSEVAVFGINYPREYFERAYLCWEIWSRNARVKRAGNGVYKNFITAYPMLNLGDDLFIHMLVTRYPREEFTLFVKNQRLKDCYSKYDNLEVIVCDSPLAVKKCRNHILIGGSMFIENVAWGVKFLNQCHVQNCAKNNFLLGANFGPYTQKEYLENYRAMLRAYQDICFREVYSQKLIGQDKARVAPDIVFGYEYSGNQQAADRVVLSVIQLKGRKGLEEYKNSYDEQMAALCREFLQAGTEVVFVSFCRGEGDEQAIRDICARMGEQERRQVRIHRYLGGNLEETMDMLAGSRWMVSSRFHGAVLGMALGKIVYPVLYSDKTKHMLDDVGFQGQSCQISEIETISRMAVLGNEKYPVSLEEVRRDAQRQFLALDRLFYRKGERK